MGKRNSKYKQLERFLSFFLVISLLFFLFFLLFSGMGLGFLKILSMILCFLSSGTGLWMLFRTREMFRSRSLWLTCSFGSVILLTLISLICRYPC